MYVSRLDRPWRETRFVFQGFHVTDPDQIEEIKQQTEYVYILVPDQWVKASRDILGGGPEATGELPPDKPTIPIEQELPIAEDGYQDIAEMIREVKKAMKSNESLDLPRVQQTIGRMVRSIERNPDAYTWLARTKNYGSRTYKQALRASVWAAALARQLDLNEQAMNDVALGTLLRDAGFARIPGEILNKPTPLTNEEWEIVKTHVHHGKDILSRTPGVPNAIFQLIDGHHERLDGSGYPRGLRGNAIPLPAQIAGIVDFFAAVTQPRPFIKHLSPSHALQLLYKQRDRYFSEKLVNCFIRALGTYPTGSLVELNTGEVGIISSQNPGRRLRPRIILLLDVNREPYGSYPIVNLLEKSPNQEDQQGYIGRCLPEGEYNLDVEKLIL